MDGPAEIPADCWVYFANRVTNFRGNMLDLKSKDPDVQHALDCSLAYVFLTSIRTFDYNKVFSNIFYNMLYNQELYRSNR